MDKRSKRPSASRLAKIQKAQDLCEDFESGESGRQAMDLGLVVIIHWLGGHRGGSLHVMIDDGVDDRRLAEWWPGTGTAVLRTDPPEWTRFDNAMELLATAARVRGSIRPSDCGKKWNPPGDKDKAKKGPSKQPPSKATKKARKTKRRNAARRLSKRRKTIAQMEADRAFHEQHCGS
ncbi:hypothetical protein LCGC14_0776400 [marine sediment metagenome]|uniref:Uncharacterized protein n=1 Tax=marine sediment metagenome TaxID=412755 RepID=A0A0F9QGM7_9ZZZZ